MHHARKMPAYRQLTVVASSRLNTSALRFSTGPPDNLSKEYQFLPGGILPSYYFQKSLPRLPVPKLELTCKRYLEALKPLLSPEQYNKTEKYVQDFEKGAGNCKTEL